MMDKQLYRSNSTDNIYLQNSINLFLREVYDLLKECYGPYGSHILIDNEIRTEATKDGKTILSRLRTDSTISTAIHNSILNVANKQVDEVGDGSTTTILLLCKLYNSFINIIQNGNISPTVLNKSIKKVVTDIINALKKHTTKVVYDSVSENDKTLIDYDLLYKAVHTSVDGNIELATKIIEMLKELDTKEPLILVELSQTEEHRYELVKGVETTGTIIRPEIFFNGMSRMEYYDPKIIIINGRLDLSIEHFMSYAQQAQRENRDTIFLATGIKEETLSGIVSMNSISPGMFTRVPIFQIRDSALDEEFKDLCVSIGAKFIDSNSFNRITTMEAVNKLIETNMGTCSKALLTEFCARFTDPNADLEATKLRIDEVNEKIESLKNDPTSYNERLLDLENRKAFLSRKYAKFFVGGYSPQRKTINYELANDGIPQAISCMKHGIVQGCNVTIPIVIKDLIKKYVTDTDPNKTYSDLDVDILNSISNAYKDLTVELCKNKMGHTEAVKFVSELEDHTKSFNIRPGDNTEVINSADTDRAILQNATDMASLLATARGFISRNAEFDIVNKGL